MTPEALQAIRERVRRATPEPWVIRRLSNHEEHQGFVQGPRAKPEDPYDIEILGEDDTLYPTRAGDLDFIAHVREDIPTLLAEVERLQVERASATEAFEDHRNKVAELEALAKQLVEALHFTQEYVGEVVMALQAYEAVMGKKA